MKSKRSEFLSVRMTPALSRAVADICRAYGLTRSDYVRRLLVHECKRDTLYQRIVRLAGRMKTGGSMSSSGT